MSAFASETVIRPVRESDEPAWRELWNAYLDFYDCEVAEAVYDTSFSRLLNDDPYEFNGLIGELDGHPVGLTHYLFHRHGWRLENVVYLQDLYVAPEARGKGIGRALIETVYRAADEAGCPSVYWLTQENNTIARQLYDRVARATNFIKYQR